MNQQTDLKTVKGTRKLAEETWEVAESNLPELLILSENVSKAAIVEDTRTAALISACVQTVIGEVLTRILERSERVASN